GRTRRRGSSRRNVCSRPSPRGAVVHALIVAGDHAEAEPGGGGTRLRVDDDEVFSGPPVIPVANAHTRGAAPMTDPNTDVFSASLCGLDAEVAQAMAGELVGQRDSVEMIASEIFVPRSGLQAQGSVLTNKDAEGYPGRRYYGGCEHVDVVENLARDRAKEIFGAEYVNVQPHSGAQANMAVYFSALEAGDTILGMNLSHGGHLTHGSPVNFSGKMYNFVEYGVDAETEEIDYDVVM